LPAMSNIENLRAGIYEYAAMLRYSLFQREELQISQ